MGTCGVSTGMEGEETFSKNRVGLGNDSDGLDAVVITGGSGDMDMLPL